jgi:hypothetical protein
MFPCPSFIEELGLLGFSFDCGFAPLGSWVRLSLEERFVIAAFSMAFRVQMTKGWDTAL